LSAVVIQSLQNFLMPPFLSHSHRKWHFWHRHRDTG